MDLSTITRLRPLRNYLTELNKAGILPGQPGNIEFDSLKHCFKDIGCQNPFTGNPDTFGLELCTFLNHVNRSYSKSSDIRENIDLLCNAL